MISFVKSLFKGTLGGLGFEVRRRRRLLSSPSNRRRGLRINVGCGSTVREGYVGCDVRALPGVDLVCRAWELSQHCEELEEVYSRHMLEHLTLAEVERTLEDWRRALKPGGRLHLIVPDMDFHCRQWLDANWSADDWQDNWSGARHAFNSIYGWQRESDHAMQLEDPPASAYWDVHKSGFCKGLMTLMLERHGFVQIDCRTEEKWHLVARARKAET